MYLSHKQTNKRTHKNEPIIKIHDRHKKVITILHYIFYLQIFIRLSSTQIYINQQNIHTTKQITISHIKIQTDKTKNCIKQKKKKNNRIDKLIVN